MAERLGTLKKRAEFLRVAGKGRRWAMPGLVLQAAKRPADDSLEAKMPRLGLTASKKVGNAVARNHAKRRLRALAREVLGESGRADTDYVVIGRAATIQRPAAALRADFLTALERVHGARASAGKEGRQG